MTFSLPASAQDEAEPRAEPVEPGARLFVSDKLVLNVYAEADQNSTRVATIETGDAIGELERAENFVRVRLADGREGWVGANYLTADAPAAVRVRELERERKTVAQMTEKKAADEIAKLKQEATALQTQVEKLRSSATAALSPVAATPPAQTPVIAAAAAAPHATGYLPWLWSSAALLACGLSFIAGYGSLARRIRKKYGGLKVY